MTTAVVPIPANTPDRTGVRLFRLSGRPALFYYDQDKTQGPMEFAFTGTFANLYADVGRYRLRLTAPTGSTTETIVQVGVGETPVEDLTAYASLGDITSAITALRSELDAAYAATGAAETISGSWDFTTAPTVDGQPVGGTVSPAAVASAVTTELNNRNLDARYARPSAGTTVSGAWDFTIAPTINGAPIGTDQTALTTAVQAAAAARAAQASADAALTQIAALTAAGTGSGGTGGGIVTPPTTPLVTQLTWVRLELAQPVVVAAADYTAIPGYPGAGKLRIGANNGTTGATPFDGYPITQMDSVVYSADGGQASTPLHKCGTVREYMAAPLFSAADWTKVQTWMGQGRVPMLQFNPGGYSYQQFIDGLADADLKAQALRFKGQAGACILSFRHEPEDIAPALQDQYRRAYRHCVQVYRDNGVTNVAWTAPYYAAGKQDFTTKNYKNWHPEWDGTDWHRDAAGNRLRWVDLLGIDWYVPNVNPSASDVNRTYSADMDVIIRNYKASGGRPMPMVVGEMGLNSAISHLESTGITIDLFLSDMVTIGAVHPDMPLWAVAFWNVNSERFNDGNDPRRNPSDALGIKRTAVRQIAVGKILRTTSGGAVVPSTPQASRVWVNNPAGNAVVSAA